MNTITQNATFGAVESDWGVDLIDDEEVTVRASYVVRSSKMLQFYLRGRIVRQFDLANVIGYGLLK
jgi:hypothetical protein